MVKRTLMPFCLQMTALTALTKAILMHIFDGVAGNTGFRRIFKTITDMTTIAAHFFMRFTQSEGGFIMIEFFVPPCFRVMTIAALTTQFIFMDIVFFVAVYAI